MLSVAADSLTLEVSDSSELGVGDVSRLRLGDKSLFPPLGEEARLVASGVWQVRRLVEVLRE